MREELRKITIANGGLVMAMELAMFTTTCEDTARFLEATTAEYASGFMVREEEPE